MTAKRRSTPSYTPVDLQKYYDFLAAPAPGNLPKTARRPPIQTKRSSISDELAREKKLKNDDAEQDIRLKKATLERLFRLLISETVLIFAFAFLQATGLFGFALEEWSFQLLTSVTIAQITIMLLVAVRYLFPKNTKS